jgi:hypothetical protein
MSLAGVPQALCGFPPGGKKDSRLPKGISRLISPPLISTINGHFIHERL